MVKTEINDTNGRKTPENAHKNAALYTCARPREMVTERKIEKYLIQAVEVLGGLCVKFPPLFFRGFPDRIVLLPGGVIVFVETKTPGGKPSLIQRKVHSRLRGLGFRVEVLDTYEKIDEFILTL